MVRNLTGILLAALLACYVYTLAVGMLARLGLE